MFWLYIRHPQISAKIDCLKGDESPPSVFLKLALDITKSDEDAKC